MTTILVRWQAAAVLAACLALAPPSFDSGAPVAPLPAPPPPIRVVNVSCCSFSDSFNGSNQTFITPGTTVQWQRLDASAYTVTSGSGSSDPQMGALFNGFLVPPAATFTYTFSSYGAFPYFCQFHQSVGMAGVVHVINPAVANVLLGGCIGSNGLEINLGNNAPPRIGDSAFALVITGGIGGATAYVFLAGSLAASPLPQLPDCLIQLDVASVTAFMAAGISPSGPNLFNASGTATFPFPIPVAASLVGVDIAAQGLVFDSLVPGGIVLSNAVVLSLGA